MNYILAFKQKVKSVIEAHGGKVDIDTIPGVIKQPTELQTLSAQESLFYYNPAEIHFDGANLFVKIAGHNYILEEAKEYLKRLQVAINILEEIEK